MFNALCLTMNAIRRHRTLSVIGKHTMNKLSIHDRMTYKPKKKTIHDRMNHDVMNQYQVHRMPQKA
jgi:hypothetical protein